MYGVAFSAFAITTIVGFLTSAFAVEAMSYAGIYYMFAGLSVISMVLLIFFKETQWEYKLQEKTKD